MSRSANPVRDKKKSNLSLHGGLSKRMEVFHFVIKFQASNVWTFEEIGKICKPKMRLLGSRSVCSRT
jgi:hypothetical protein